LEAEGARQRGRPRKRLCTRKRMIPHNDAMDCSTWKKMIRGNWTGVTEAVTVMPRSEYELYVSGVSSPRLTWI